MHKFGRALLLATLLVSIGIDVTAATAAESGMAGIHSWRKVGKKTCLVGHNHDGSGSGPTPKAAEAEAIRAWVSFTDLEYGDSWADWRLAIEKAIRCDRSASGVSCQLVATPCRGW